ncbi:hypothetical protein BX600DRAFT_507143 [Xylariales sp. PMI_506]|nr:hypothetical protein BX600DRAFT_507143 [Xylariales sp. PMI_506]
MVKVGVQPFLVLLLALATAIRAGDAGQEGRDEPRRRPRGPLRGPRRSLQGRFATTEPEPSLELDHAASIIASQPAELQSTWVEAVKLEMRSITFSGEAKAAATSPAPPPESLGSSILVVTPISVSLTASLSTAVAPTTTSTATSSAKAASSSHQLDTTAVQPDTTPSDQGSAFEVTPSQIAAIVLGTVIGTATITLFIVYIIANRRRHAARRLGEKAESLEDGRNSPKGNIAMDNIRRELTPITNSSVGNLSANNDTVRPYRHHIARAKPYPRQNKPKNMSKRSLSAENLKSAARQLHRKKEQQEEMERRQRLQLLHEYREQLKREQHEQKQRQPLPAKPQPAVVNPRLSALDEESSPRNSEHLSVYDAGGDTAAGFGFIPKNMSMVLDNPKTMRLQLKRRWSAGGSKRVQVLRVQSYSEDSEQSGTPEPYFGPGGSTRENKTQSPEIPPVPPVPLRPPLLPLASSDTLPYKPASATSPLSLHPVSPSQQTGNAVTTDGSASTPRTSEVIVPAFPLPPQTPLWQPWSSPTSPSTGGVAPASTNHIQTPGSALEARLPGQQPSSPSQTQRQSHIAFMLTQTAPRPPYSQPSAINSSNLNPNSALHRSISGSGSGTTASTGGGGGARRRANTLSSMGPVSPVSEMFENQEYALASPTYVSPLSPPPKSPFRPPLRPVRSDVALSGAAGAEGPSGAMAEIAMMRAGRSSWSDTVSALSVDASEDDERAARFGITRSTSGAGSSNYSSAETGRAVVAPLRLLQRFSRSSSDVTRQSNPRFTFLLAPSSSDDGDREHQRQLDVHTEEQQQQKQPPQPSSSAQGHYHRSTSASVSVDSGSGGGGGSVSTRSVSPWGSTQMVGGAGRPAAGGGKGADSGIIAVGLASAPPHHQYQQNPYPRAAGPAFVSHAVAGHAASASTPNILYQPRFGAFRTPVELDKRTSEGGLTTGAASSRYSTLD